MGRGVFGRSALHGAMDMIKTEAAKKHGALNWYKNGIFVLHNVVEGKQS